MLRRIKAAGYTGCESNVRFVAGQFARAAEARREIAATGVQYIGAHLSMEEYAPQKLAPVAKAVAAMGGSAIVMSAQRHELAAKVDQLNRSGRVCRDAGIRLAYHNHNPEFEHHNAEIDALARATDASLVHFLVDAGHATLGGGDPAAFLARHAARVIGFHLKTFLNMDFGRQVPLGKGDFGFEALAAAIDAAHWGGWLIVEEGGGKTPANADAVAPDREYVRRVFGV